LLPTLKLTIVILATYADPVSFQLGHQALNLREHLTLEYIIPIEVRLCQLTHGVGVYVNGSHGIILLIMVLELLLSTAMYLLVVAVSSARSNIPLPTRFQYRALLQMVAPMFSGLSALLAGSTFAEAKKQRTSTMINPGRQPAYSYGNKSARGGIDDGAN
jgi:hypothetical protein